MKTVCLVATFGPVVQPERPIAGRVAEAWLRDSLRAALPAVPVQALTPCETAGAFVDAMAAASTGFDEVVLVSADAPFLRPDLVAEVLRLHRDYHADYTFADGFPTGLAPEVFVPALLEALRPWAQAKRGRVTRETLFELLSTDINRFDVETHLSPVDLRSRRLSLTTDTLRNRLLLDRYAADTSLETPAFLRVLEATQERARTLPATLHVQITDGLLQVPVWSPVSQMVPDVLSRRGTLDRDLWNRLLDDTLAFAGDLTVLPSFWGEPSLHPQVAALFADALAKPGLSLCVETSGLGWSSVDLSELAGHPRLDWIVELDSNDPDTYRRLRGEGFDEAHGFTARLLELFPGRVWPQAVRMVANEGEMEAFHNEWKAKAGRVILQKHNDFGGRLTREKPSDLSPWKRHPCWHLARDLAVFLDGTVVVCRDDFQRSQPLGNAWTDEPGALWERGTVLFARHVKGDWPEVCRNCDEWYTFHF